jgi:DNA primase
VIRQETIAKILDAARVEEVVGEFVSLKKKGGNYTGLCPFHNEKTPSFYVSPVKGIYKCFGCSASGTAVRFLMDHEHYTYPEALRYLAKKYNIEVEEHEQTAEDIKAAGERESLYSVTALAASFFTETLWNTEPGRSIALSYFEERDFSHATITKFGLGFAPDSRDALFKFAATKGYKPEYLEKAGLVLDKDGTYIDRFRNRVIFPIHNLSGRVIGFGGRILTREKNLAKYINSPESEIYHKTNVLYGISFAKKDIASLDNCYLVEGYTDVISMHQAGITNVVASSGTSLTTEQIRLIKRYTSNITILYDGDLAGIKASFRGIDMVLQEALNVRIVLFPDGEDPDSFSRKKRPEEVKEYITTQANDFIVFKTNLLLKEAEGDPIKRAGLIKEIISSIALIPDGIIREAYVRECSSLMDMREQTLIFELNKLLRKGQKKEDAPAEPIASENQPIEIPAQKDNDRLNLKTQELNIIRILISYGDQDFSFPVIKPKGIIEEVPVKTGLFIVNELIEDEYTFENPIYHKIFSEYKEAFKNELVPGEQFFINHSDTEISDFTISLIATPFQLSPNWFDRKGIHTPTELEKLKDLVINSVYSLKLRKIEIMIAEIQEEIKTADEIDVMLLLKKQFDLQTLRSAVSKQLGRIILN